MKRVAVNEVASELRNQADHDYISARHLYALGFADQFMWQAQQTLEKLLKSAILFNWPLPYEAGTLPPRLDGRKRKSEKQSGYGHDLARMVNDLTAITPWQPDVPAQVRAYISHVQMMGLNRYGDRHEYRIGDELPRLDESVWHLRKWSSYHPLVPPKNHSGSLTQERWIEVRREQTTRLKPGSRQHIGGLLELLLDERRERAMWTRWQARAALIRWNCWFYSTRPSIVSPPRLGSSSVPVWGRGWARNPEVANLLMELGIGPLR
jgi:hypothetical protein